MAVEVERLVVSLEGRVTAFERAMDRAAARSSAATSRIERDADRMSARVQAAYAKAGAKAGESFKSFFAGAAAGAVATFSIDGIAKSIADLAKLQDVAERTGVSTKAIQEFGYAVEQSGGEIADVQNGLQKFAVNLSKAGQGGGDLYKILEANNVALKDQAGAIRPVSDLLGDIAELIRNASSEQDQLNIATAAFGRGAGPALVQALAGGRAGLADFAAKAQAASVVLDDKVIKKAADLDDKIATLKRQIDGVGKQLVTEFAGPALVEGLEGFLKSLREASELIDAIRNGDVSKVFSGFKLEGGILGAVRGEPGRDRLEADAARIRAEINSLGAGRQSTPLTEGKLDLLRKKLADIEDRIRRINANPLDFVPKHAGLTDGATPLPQIDVEGKPTILPSEGDGDALLGDAIKAYVARVIKAESGGDTNAKNPNSTAAGVGQFINSTFVDQFRKTYASEYSRILAEAGGSEAAAARVVLSYRSNAEISKNLIESYAKENAKALADAGQAVTEANLHLAHFLGSNGAIAALRANPSDSARAVLGDRAANANPTIIGNGHSIQDVLDYAQRRANATRIAAGDLTPAEEKAKDAKKSYDDSLRESDQRTAALGRESEALNQNAYAKAFAAEKARLLADIEKEGNTASSEQVAAIDGKAAAYARQAQAMDNLEKTSKDVARAQQEIGEIGAEATKTFVSELRSGASAADALKAALDRVIDRLLDSVIDNIFKGLFSGAGGGLFGGGGGLLGGLFGGARASGGPVEAGKVYMVGEKGPEPFIPGRSGTILPNSSLARVRAPVVPQARASSPRISPEVRMRIDLTGANGDETIRRIAGQAAESAGRRAYEAAVQAGRRDFKNQRARAEIND